VSIGWAPSHVGIDGNDRVDRIAKNASSGNVYVGVPPRSTDFLPLAR
jgi:ribonuclease HI